MADMQAGRALDDTQLEEVSGGMTQEQFRDGIFEPIGDTDPGMDGGMFRVTCRVCGNVMEMAINPMVKCDRCRYPMMGDIGLSYQEVMKKRREYGLA